jgi:hypothetical protein
MMEVYIITFKTEQMDDRIGAVYCDLASAKEEVERLEGANLHANLQAGIVVRQVERPREWTERQKRWMRGRR